MRIQASAALPIVLVFGCGGDGGTEPQVPMTASVEATAASSFTPSLARVRKGGTVTWQFGTVAHSVVFTGTGRPADIAGDNMNTSVSRTFASEGRFEYECSHHPGMRGVVEAVVGNTPTGGGPYGDPYP